MLPSFTISPIPFALKTAFTFTLNWTAKTQCSFTTDMDIRISLRNGLDFQYKTIFSLRHSPNWQTISLLTLKHLHYALLSPEKACLSISFYSPPPHMLPPKRPSEHISPSLPSCFSVPDHVELNWIWQTKLGEGEEWGEFGVFLIWFREWRCTTASCWCLSSREERKVPNKEYL